MKGKLIIIEAGDGSGKATQTKALYDHLKADGHKVHRIEFPDYADDSSALVRMYLGGAFGEKAADVNAFAASTFFAVDRSLEEGRKQVARIVGRDTSELSAQEIRTAALETLAENLSDGVIAPLFWLTIAGVPGMLAYKMVNTLDSMIGYKTDRYKDFGCFAARLDDVANYIPARLTAFLMVLASGRFSLLKFVAKYGSKHASPNSGYPEAALAGILNCRFGGPHTYFGQLFDKPYIGENDRPLTTDDMRTATRVNRIAECLAILLVILIFSFLYLFIFQI